MKKFNKGDWALTLYGEGIVLGFETTPSNECAWILLIGDSNPYLFELRLIERADLYNE